MNQLAFLLLCALASRIQCERRGGSSENLWGMDTEESNLEQLGYGRDVCEPGKSWLPGRKKVEDPTKRFEVKQTKALALSESIKEKHCLHKCMGCWIELSIRIRKMASCAKVPINDETELSKLVWGDGPNSLKGFITKAIKNMADGLNNNKDVKSIMERGNCTFRFDRIEESTKAHLKRDNLNDEAVADATDAITKDIIGAECDYKKVNVLRMFLITLRKTINNIVKN